MANRLSAGGGNRVLLIEAGSSDWSPYIHMPVGLLWLKGKRWDYPGEPDPSMSGVESTWAGGKVLGGSGSINGMVWVRGNPSEFDEWAELGCGGWDYQGVLPYFKRAESFEDGESVYRGGSGPVRTGRQRVSHRLTDAFIEAGVHAGHVLNPDYNGERQEGVGYSQANQRRGFRHSMARAHLGPARWRRNLRVLTGAFATRILFDGKRAVGVEFERGGRVYRADAAKEVIVSGGSLASPKLLMLSGVGPADHLRECGVDVVANVPGVGQNLRDHLITRLTWNVNVPTLNRELNPAGFLKHGADFLLRGRGAAAACVWHAMIFLKLRPESRYPDICAGFMPLGHAAPSKRPGGQRPKMSPDNTVSIVMTLLHPRGRGELRLRSADSAEPPSIRYQLLAHDDDVRDLMAGARAVQRVFEEEPLRQYVATQELPPPGVQTDAEWETHLRKATMTGWHAVGTCKMGGADDPEAVLDPQLRVRGVEGLRVVDASIMPGVTSGNTNAPTVMIAEKAADLINRGGSR